MVISDEIKFPRHIRVEPYKTETRVESVEHLAALQKIGQFSRRWAVHPERRQKQKDKKKLSGVDLKAVQNLLKQVNEDLDRHDVLIRLVLSHDEGGYTLDVYDCTNQTECRIINDIVINVDELSILLRNLHQEAGLLVDTVL